MERRDHWTGCVSLNLGLYRITFLVHRPLCDSLNSVLVDPDPATSACSPINLLEAQTQWTRGTKTTRNPRRGDVAAGSGQATAPANGAWASGVADERDGELYAPVRPMAEALEDGNQMRRRSRAANDHRQQQAGLIHVPQ